MICCLLSVYMCMCQRVCEQICPLTAHSLLRMLIPTTELGQFDSMVMPFELEAYDVLKSRSRKQGSAFFLHSLTLIQRVL